MKARFVMNITRKLRAQSSERDQLFHGGVAARYNVVLPFAEGKNVLDVGSGLGFGANYVASVGKARKVLGIDYSGAAVASARSSFTAENLEFAVMDATDLKLPRDSFDVVIAYEIIEHLPIEFHSTFLASLVRLLKDSGVCFISTPNKLYAPSGELRIPCAYHTKEFDSAELVGLLRKHFSRISLHGIRLVNKEYMDGEEKMIQSLRYRLLSFIGQFRIIRKLSAIFPPEFRKKVTSEESLPKMALSDFEISEDVQNCKDFLALCRKR
jgi:2-polyprenyl-3-methyl-5-hydroxy-6-metoxy-1,4-benzoquinol methylase